MKIQNLDISKQITIGDLVIPDPEKVYHPPRNIKSNRLRIIKDHRIQDVHDCLLSMKSDKWYPIPDLVFLKITETLIETGYYQNIVFDNSLIPEIKQLFDFSIFQINKPYSELIQFKNYKSFIKIKSDEETKEKNNAKRAKSETKTNETGKPEVNIQ